MNAITRLLGAESRGDYKCRGCGSAFDVQYHVCPVCRGFSVDSVSFDTE